MKDEHENLIRQMTLEEKVSLLSGADLWDTRGVERLGIPPFRMTDGPSGARGTSRSTRGPTAACFPCGTALAATWNPSLIEEVGAALGEEARTKGAHVLLGPTVNIHRSPLAGRNFECYSEDPHLSGRLAVAFIKGVQSRGVGACVKHFVCNDSEFERHTISSEVGERALREIYLVPFEAAVSEAQVWSVMAAYNKVNGTYASESRRLLTEILRDEWGFEGFVVSDWGGTQSTVAAANAGLDLEMPGPGRHRAEKLVEAARKGEVRESVIDAMVRRLLRVALLTGAFEDRGRGREEAVDRPEHRRIARRAATEGMVLLKNESGLLPLDAAALHSLAVIGPNAGRAVIQGGGSCHVEPHYSVSPLEAIQKRCGDGVEVASEAGCTIDRTIPAPDPRTLSPAGGLDGEGLRGEYFNGFELSGEPALTRLVSDARMFFFGEFAPGVDPRAFSLRLVGTFTPPETGTYRFGLLSAGKSRLFVDGREVLDNWTRQAPGEGFYGLASAEVVTEIELSADKPCELRIEYTSEGTPIGGLQWGCSLAPVGDPMERAVAEAARADAALVVVGLDPEWETEGRDRGDMELPGRQRELIERIAAANPKTIVVLNAGSPLRMDWIDRVPAVIQMWYPGQEAGNAVADVLFGDANPSGKLPTTFPLRLEDNPAFLDYPGENGQVAYGEGIFVGYRYYDARCIEPRFPFGHGLSYATFAYEGLHVTAGEPTRLRFDVTNTGARSGQEVAQVYVRDVEASLSRPEKELKAFVKLDLDAGETRTVEVALDRRAFAFYDPARASWIAEPGEFEILVGASSRDIRLRAGFTWGS